MVRSHILERLRFKYSRFVIVGCAIFVLTVVSLAFASGDTPSPEEYLLIGLSNFALAITSLHRGVKSSGSEKAGWILLFVISTLRVVANLSFYPSAGEPVTPETLATICGLALLLLSCLFWNKFRNVSWTRIFVDSLWISVCILGSLGFVIAALLTNSSRVSTVEIVSLLVAPAALLMGMALCLNGWYQSRGTGFTVIGLVLGLSLIHI